jgi:hypothetical protein
LLPLNTNIIATTSQTERDWWRGVAHGVLNVPVPEIVLNEAGVRALVGEGKTAGMVMWSVCS